MGGVLQRNVAMWWGDLSTSKWEIGIVHRLTKPVHLSSTSSTICADEGRPAEILRRHLLDYWLRTESPSPSPPVKEKGSPYLRSKSGRHTEKSRYVHTPYLRVGCTYAYVVGTCMYRSCAITRIDEDRSYRPTECLSMHFQYEVEQCRLQPSPAFSTNVHSLTPRPVSNNSS